MQKVVDKLLEWVYPEPVKCMECGQELRTWEVSLGLCKKCVDGLRLFSENGLERVEGLGEQYFDHVQGVALYEGLIKDWIYRLKYYGEREKVFPLVELVNKQGVIGEWDGVIPIPLHVDRLGERGYNQALLVAQGVAYYMKKPCVEWLVRVRATVPQNRLKPGERQSNLHGVFELREGAKVEGGRWLIVDDIFTTGTTVNEAARVLKEGGAKKVGVLVLASGRMM